MPQTPSALPSAAANMAEEARIDTTHIHRFIGALPFMLAKERAAFAVDKLIRIAESGENVLVCGHGWFNRMLRPHIKRRGFACVHNGGDKYWSYRIYQKK